MAGAQRRSTRTRAKARAPRPATAPRQRRRAARSHRGISRSHALQVLKEVAEALNRAPTVERAAADALARMADLLGVETGWVWLRDPGSGQFYSAAAQSLPPYLSEPVRMTGKSCWCLELFREGALQPRNIDVLECTRLAPAVARHQASLTRGLRCHASVPVYAGEVPIGVMNLAMRDWRRLTRQELDLLGTIADQVGVAIERARLAEATVELARADERARIARDVHDTLAQGFTAVALHVEAGLAALDAGDRARPPLDRALAAARDGLEEARRSIGSLRGASAERLPLAESVASLARRFTADTGVRVQVAMRGALDLPASIESDLHHVVSEALANIRKHASAREARIELAVKRGRVSLSIADDGAGFRATRGKASRGTGGPGLGLEGIRERIEALGGSASIASRPGCGTTIRVSVPLPATTAPKTRARRTPARRP
jgi:two-component system, NarL family, sensor kinase